MEVDESVRKQLIENLEEWLEDMHRVMKNYIEKINKAETVEDIMLFKKYMLARYVKSMPCGVEHCYFCLVYWFDDDCEPCEYSVFHGVCDTAESDYSEIDKLRNKLLDKIEEKYYRGEDYDCGGEE